MLVVFLSIVVIVGLCLVIGRICEVCYDEKWSLRLFHPGVDRVVIRKVLQSDAYLERFTETEYILQDYWGTIKYTPLKNELRVSVDGCPISITVGFLVRIRLNKFVAKRMDQYITDRVNSLAGG